MTIVIHKQTAGINTYRDTHGRMRAMSSRDMRFLAALGYRFVSMKTGMPL